MEQYNHFFGFLLKIGKIRNAKIPKTTVISSCDVQTIQPKALPATSGIPYKNKIFAIIIGKNPKPPFVKAMIKLPITKATNAVPIERLSVSVSVPVEL